MKAAIALMLLATGSLWGRGDTLSGPTRTTIQNLSWGTIYFEASRLGACEMKPTPDGFQLTSAQGRVVIKGSEAYGFHLSCGADSLTVLPLNGGGGIEIHGQGQSWTLRSMNGDLTLTSSKPKDTLVFKRNGNSFSIEGSKGQVTVTSESGNQLSIQSPLGVTTVTNYLGARTFTGPALDRIPYLGSGLFIPFHGAGLFIDVARAFPMPEISEWVDWKPILRP